MNRNVNKKINTQIECLSFYLGAKFNTKQRLHGMNETMLYSYGKERKLSVL